MSFQNPYNFVPALPRTGLPDGLADGAPPGHHRWHDDRWSGEIDVALEVVTPLLVTRTRSTGSDGHRELEVATTADERVDLAPTQLKGMIRNAFEMVTNSRFGVFDHPDALGYRAQVEGAANLLPALVTGPDGVEILGTLKGVPAFAKVRLWDDARHRLHDGFAHGAEVEAVISWYDHGGGDRGWKVDSLHRPGEATDGGVRVAGRLHAPGPTIKNKRHEAVFITDVLAGPDDLTIEGWSVVPRGRARELVTGLRLLIRNQREEHTHAGRDELWGDNRKPWEYRGHEPGQTAWSRHLYAREAGAPAHLGPDTVVPPADGDVVTCWAEGTRRLRPVKVSRLLYQHPPETLLDPSLHPARSIDELSPADRVFGWTWNRPGRDERRPEPSAHRGQLRIVDLATPTAAEAVEDLAPLTIPPLSTPKPGQGRFYLGKKQPGGPPAALERVRRPDFFQPASQELRGRKVYPHQRRLEGETTEKLRKMFAYKPVNDRPERDAQNVTLHQWIRPGARLTFTIRVTDLHPLELGALLWLLDPERAGRDGARARHRLGGGRPLGFGSVELTTVATRLHRGDAMRDRLSYLNTDVELDDADDLASTFEKAALGPVLDAVRWALAGYGPRTNVYYPRTHPTSPIYEWFVENEKSARQALPTFDEQRSLLEKWT